MSNQSINQSIIDEYEYFLNCAFIPHLFNLDCFKKTSKQLPTTEISTSQILLSHILRLPIAQHIHFKFARRRTAMRIGL